MGLRALTLAIALFASVCAISAHAQMPDPDVCGVALAFETQETNVSLNQCAANGDPGALAQLGMIYLGADPDYPEFSGLDENLTGELLITEGLRLLRAASDGGSAIAQTELGFAYMNGDFGLPVDMDMAFSFLQRASDAGDEIGSYNLAKLYFLGRGAPQSQELGEALLRRSAERGYKPARCSLARWLERLPTPDASAEARALRAAAAMGDHGFPCGQDDYMSELPLIATDQTL
jgi:TPR repeat protein